MKQLLKFITAFMLAIPVGAQVANAIRVTDTDSATSPTRPTRVTITGGSNSTLTNLSTGSLVSTSFVRAASATVNDDAYDASAWNGSTNVPTKNALRDKIESIVAGGVSDGDKGDITVSGSGATWTIDNNVVTFGKFQDITTDRLLGRDTAASGDPEEISVSGGLEFTGSAGIQRSALTGDVTASAGSASTTIANDAVTYAKMQNISATDRLLGRDTAGSGDTEELTVAGGLEFTGSGGIQRSALTGDVTASAGGGSTTVANDAVTYAKMQNVSAASRLIGRGDSGSGDPQEISLGAGLSMSGTTLSASGSATALNDIADSTGNGAVTSGHTHSWDFTLDGSTFMTWLISDADNASDTIGFSIDANDSADANTIFLRMRDDVDGTPRTVYSFSATAFTSAVAGTFGTGNGQIDIGTAGVRLTSDGDGAWTWLGLGDGNDEDLTWNLDDTANTVSVSSSTGVADLDFGTIDLNTDTLDLTGTGTINGLDAIDATGETTLEAALDIAGEVTSTGMGSTVIGDSVTVSGWTMQGTTTLGALAGAIDAGAATSVEIPNGNDPDLTVEGQISWDNNGDVLRGFDGTAQVAIGRKIEALHVTIITPQDLADAQRDSFLFWSNESGMSFVVTGWKGWSGTDDTTLEIEVVDADGTSNSTVVDAVEIATGSGPYTGSDTTITSATIANGRVLRLDFDDTDSPTYVKMTIYGYYDANVN